MTNTTKFTRAYPSRIKHQNHMKYSLRKSPGNYQYNFKARGCHIGNRKYLWRGYEGAMHGSHIELEEEPTNQYDPNAVVVMCCGELYGTIGYVGKEYCQIIKEVLSLCKSYRVELIEPISFNQAEISLRLIYEPFENLIMDIPMDSIQREIDEDDFLKRKILKEKQENKFMDYQEYLEYDSTDIHCFDFLMKTRSYTVKPLRTYFEFIEDIYKQQNYENDTSYIILEPQPSSSVYGQESMMMSSMGRVRGPLGFVGKEYYFLASAILMKCKKYRIEPVETMEKIYERYKDETKEAEIWFRLYWI